MNVPTTCYTGPTMCMRAIALVVLLSVATSGCDREAAPSEGTKAEPAGAEVTTQIPTEKEIRKEVAKGVDDVLKGGAPKWKFEYSGDLKGAVEGGIMSVVSVSRNTTIAGGAMTTTGKKRKAPQAFNATIMRYGDTPHVQMSLTLPDGTKCSALPGKDFATIDVVDEDRETFKATLKGDLTCGESKDKKIKYTAHLNKEP